MRRTWGILGLVVTLVVVCVSLQSVSAHYHNNGDDSVSSITSSSSTVVETHKELLITNEGSVIDDHGCNYNNNKDSTCYRKKIHHFLRKHATIVVPAGRVYCESGVCPSLEVVFGNAGVPNYLYGCTTSVTSGYIADGADLTLSNSFGTSHTYRAQHARLNTNQQLFLEIEGGGDEVNNVLANTLVCEDQQATFWWMPLIFQTAGIWWWTSVYLVESALILFVARHLVKMTDESDKPLCGSARHRAAQKLIVYGTYITPLQYASIIVVTGVLSLAYAHAYIDCVQYTFFSVVQHSVGYVFATMLMDMFVHCKRVHLVSHVAALFYVELALRNGSSWYHAVMYIVMINAPTALVSIYRLFFPNNDLRYRKIYTAMYSAFYMLSFLPLVLMMWCDVPLSSWRILFCFGMLFLALCIVLGGMFAWKMEQSEPTDVEVEEIEEIEENNDDAEFDKGGSWDNPKSHASLPSPPTPDSSSASKKKKAMGAT